MEKLIRSITQSLSDKCGIRLTGSDGDRRGIRYLSDLTSDIFGKAEVQEYAFLGWQLTRPGRFAIGGQTVPFFPSWGSTAARRVKGRLVNVGAWPDGQSFCEIRDREERIAALVVRRRAGVAVPSLWSETGAFPVVYVGTEGESLVDDALKDGAEVELDFDAEFIPGARSANVSGVIPGRSDDEIVIVAHHDSVYTSPGANDNAATVAAMIAVGQQFVGERPAYALRFLASGSEESGSQGVLNYLCRRIAEGTAARMRLVINLDSLTWGDYFRYGISKGPERPVMEQLAQSTWEATGRPDKVEYFKPDPLVCDDAPFRAFGFPTCYINTRGGVECKELWHTAQDTSDRVDYPRAARCAGWLKTLIEESMKLAPALPVARMKRAAG